jgi:hypothetical protein
MNRKRRKRFSRYLGLLAVPLIIFTLIVTILSIFSHTNTLNPGYYFLGQNNDLINPSLKVWGVSDVDKKMKDMNFEYTSIKENKSNKVITVTLNNGVQGYFSSEKDIDWQVNSLKKILSKLTIENKKPKIINFVNAKTIVNL